MAIIYSYPEKTTLADGDLFVITDSEQTAPNKNRTKSLSASDLKTYTQTGVGTVTSVALAMPSAFSVAGSPITGSGTFTVTGSGTTSQYVDGTGALQSFSDTAANTVARLIPFATTASPGGSETYTALNNIVKIGWSGGNGIYVFNLPSATAIPYRVIRFTTNGTYPGGGAHKVRFTPTGGETIDGAAFFEISKVYEGISIWSTGTEWVVIQAKAH
jgi:hypothetical protein